MPYTDFHYTPTGTGVISGKEVLEQTEDAINDLGGQISGDVQTAIDTANNALNTANTASADAQNAVNTANTAYTAATNAQNTANAAQNTASNALTAAQNAQNDVNALGNRVTTAENNITQNTTDISGLTTRMGTAENNISTLQNDVVTAQGTATSAQNTATMARQQAYVLRYSSSAITDNSTIAYSTLDNTDNIKVSDKIIDTDGKIFSIVSVDSANETVTVGSALIDLALDANVMHLSGNESASGNKNFEGILSTLPNSTLWPSDTNTSDDITMLGDTAIHIEYKTSGKLLDLSGGAWNVVELGLGCLFFRFNNGTDIRFKHFATNLVNRIYVVNGANRHINDLIPDQDNTRKIGSGSLRWATINDINPGALSLPDLSNGLDISGYLDTSKSSINTYTPVVDGWISIKGRSSTTSGIVIIQDGMSQMGQSVVDFDSTDRVAFCALPVKAGVQVTIWLKSVTSLDSAKFYPCLGNV